MTPASRWLQRVAAIALGLTVGIALDELILQSLAFFQAREVKAHTRETASGEDRPLVLFVGDSNIYGVYVRREETLPMLVEDLSRRQGERGVRVRNLAIPGSASWHVLRQIDRGLAEKPAAIVMTCGINNFSQSPPGQGLGILEELRVMKLARRTYYNFLLEASAPSHTPFSLGSGEVAAKGLNLHTSEGTAVLMQGRDGTSEALIFHKSSGPSTEQESLRRYRADVKEMIRRSREAGTRLVFSTYFAGELPGFQAPTQVLREESRECGIPIADNASAFLQAMRLGSASGRLEETPEWHARFAQLMTADRHPTALGYQVEARVLARTLSEIGLVSPKVLEDPMAPVASMKAIVPEVRQVSTDPIRIEVHAQPLDRVTVLIGPSGGSDYLNLPLAIDRWPATRLLERELGGLLATLTDDSGKGEITIPKALTDGIPNRPLYAQVVAQRGQAAFAAQVSISERVELTLPAAEKK
ncbi:MAG: SGNH/GDSL hydrolase family protein [Planctomycetes bacterium]|nr:SGNH/GDSL hydrolase family protein [Planctomycetota bacterium]